MSIVSFSVPSSIFAVLFQVPCVKAYQWAFDNAPSQCGPLVVSITDQTGGEPPYSLLLVPHGPSPLPNGVDTRTVQTVAFNTTTELNFTLNYPAGSELVAVVSDRSGFATGGTSAAWTVQQASSSAQPCFNETQEADQAWFFDQVPANTNGVLISCESYLFEWYTQDPGIVGTPNFIAIIPSGHSFNITSPTRDLGPNATDFDFTGFNWSVPIEPGTSVILVGGDQRAAGSGGPLDYNVQSPSDSSATACTTSLFSTTSGVPAGGNPTNNVAPLSSSATPSTSTPSSSTSSSIDRGSHVDVGAIAGGVVGGIVGLSTLFLVIYCLLKRQQKAHPIDLNDEYPVPVNAEITPFTEAMPFDPQTLYAHRDDPHLTPSSEQEPSTSTHATPSPHKEVDPSTVTPQTTFVRHVDSGRVEIPEAEGHQIVELPPLYESTLEDQRHGIN